MSEQALFDKFLEEDAVFLNLKNSIEENQNPTILCSTKKNNPNYLSIISVNTKFLEAFNIKIHNLIGKNYDFLFTNVDFDYASEDHMEYVRLIKSVKDFHACSVIISTADSQSGYGDSIRLKVDFNPTSNAESNNRFATFSFTKIEQENFSTDLQKETKVANQSLMKNLERALRNERLLRQIGSLIISDLEIREIAQKIAKSLCENLRVDRCILHDYGDGEANFVVEYCDKYAEKILKDKDNQNALKLMADYINFQNKFFVKFGRSDKNTSLTIVEDVASDHNFRDVQGLCKKFSIVSQIAVTTTFNGKINGGIYIHQSSKRSWLADEIELIEMVANQFSIAIDRSKSIERVMISNHALIEKTLQLKEALKHEQEIRKMQNEFVALVSHEFKTPLQIIDGTRELLTRKIKNLGIFDDSLSKSLDRIKSGIQRMNGLIHSTLNLAKMESADGKINLEKQVFDLKSFVQEIIEKNSDLANNKKIKVVCKIDELPKDFDGDPKLLEHSFTNIISNAIKYSRDSTTVKILAKTSDKKVALRVIDQGIGIPKGDLPRIGQKFFRAKNTLAVAGTGIGIYLTKHFVELHGGEFQIESEVDVGTTVTVILPR